MEPTTPLKNPHTEQSGTFAAFVVSNDRLRCGASVRPGARSGKDLRVKQPVQQKGVNEHRQRRTDQHRHDQLRLPEYIWNPDRNEQAVRSPECRRRDGGLNDILPMDRAHLAKKGKRHPRDQHSQERSDNGRIGRNAQRHDQLHPDRRPENRRDDRQDQRDRL